MSFDLSAVMATAQDVANAKGAPSKGNESSSNYRYLYPSIGTVRVKLLFNPKSNMLARITKKHVVGDARAMCLSMYGEDCPVCKVVKSIKNAVGNDLWKFNARTRAVAFAQYVGSTNVTWNNDNPEPQVGEVVILMCPWSVYQDIQRLIVNCGSNAEQLIAKNAGKVLNISRWLENGMTKYKCEVDAFAPDFKSAESDEAFESMLRGLPSLMEVNAPAEMTEEMVAKAREVADSLSREYLKPANSAPMQISTAYQPPANPAPVSAPTPAPAGAPTNSEYPCIGNYNPNDSKCVACLKGVACKLFSDSVPF